MKKVAVIGRFLMDKHGSLGGQHVKSRIIVQELVRKYGKENVTTIDSNGGLKFLLCLPFILLKSFYTCRNIVMLPAQRGVLIIIPMAVFFNCFFKKRLHYVVIGGWLPNYIKKKPFICGCLNRLYGIYVETNHMKKILEDMLETKMFLMPNCKSLHIKNEAKVWTSANVPYPLCTFSRVQKMKGVDDAINAVKAINKKCGRTIYTLDIYGGVAEADKEWFERIKAEFTSDIRYKGIIPFDKSTEVLQAYFALLFPTHYFMEGNPGTIIDAFASGVPVVASRWQNFSDMIVEGETGLGYEFGIKDRLIDVLNKIAAHPDIINRMRAKCLQKAKSYLPQNVLTILEKEII